MITDCCGGPCTFDWMVPCIDTVVDDDPGREAARYEFGAQRLGYVDDLGRRPQGTVDQLSQRAPLQRLQTAIQMLGDAQRRMLNDDLAYTRGRDRRIAAHQQRIALPAAQQYRQGEPLEHHAECGGLEDGRKDDHTGSRPPAELLQLVLLEQHDAVRAAVNSPELGHELRDVGESATGAERESIDADLAGQIKS